MTAFSQRNVIAARTSPKAPPSYLLICGGEIGTHGSTSCRNRRQKGEKAQVAKKILSGTFPEADDLGLADILVGSNLKLTFEETVRSKRTYLRKANAVL